ncbi:MAG: TolC family protein [bacterium]
MLIFLLLFGFVLESIAGDSLKLSDAIRYALDKNYSIQIVKKTSEIAKNNYSTGNSGMLPKLDAYGGANISMTNLEMELAGSRTTSDSGSSAGNMIISKDGNVTRNYNAGVDLNMTLFDGFAMFISYDKYEAIYDKSMIEIRFSIENMLKNLINTYFEALKLQQRLEILRESISISKDRLNRTKDKVEYGAALKIEVSKAEVDLNTDSSNFMQTELAYNNMIRNLNYVMGQNISDKISLNKDIDLKPQPEFSSILSASMEKNSSLLKAIQDKKISEFDYKIVQSIYYPRITFKTGYSFTRQESDAGYMLMNQNLGFNAALNATFNLYDGSKTSIQSQNAQVNLFINEIKVEDTKKQIELALTNAFDNFGRRKEIYNLEKENVKTARDNYERAEELYKLGQLTSIEFRDAQINLMNAKNRINEALYSAKVAESELLLIGGIYSDIE